VAKINSTRDFYVYVHRRATDGSVFYVGKGTADRAWVKSSRKNSHWHRIVAKYGRTVEIVQYGMQEWWALEFECELIASYGRNKLANFTDGGEGSSGSSHSDETKYKLSILAKNRSIEYRSKISKALTGKKASDITRKKLSDAHIGMKRTKESILKSTLFHTGSKRSQLTKDRIKAKKSIIEHTNARKIKCLTTGSIFESAKNAALWLVLNGREKAKGCGITQCLSGKSKTAYGHCWEYA